MKHRRVTIKIGSNVLARPDGMLDVTRMSALVDQICALRNAGIEVVVISSGAVASGRSELKSFDIPELDSVSSRQLFSAVGQVKLMNRYTDLFRSHNVEVGQVLTVKENFATPVHYENQRNCMEVMLENGVVPIVNENDTVSVTELMFTDNDELSGLVSIMMGCEALVILSNIDGVYDGDPSDPQSKVIGKILPGEDFSKHISSSKSGLGRGGMSSKYRIARQVAAQGVEVIIANGKRENIITDLLLDSKPEPVPCTVFVASDAPKADVREMLAMARKASKQLLSLADDQINSVLCDVADALQANVAKIVEANALDLQRMDASNPKYDRLALTSQRIHDMASDMRNVASLPSPRKVIDSRVRPNGLKIRREAVPFGVIGVIYEARPNVTTDVFGLCFKSGNACVLKGGSDAECSNRAIVDVMRAVLANHGINPDVLMLLPPTREATDELLGARGIVDLIIPRGSAGLIASVREKAQVPVIETGAGVCHCYVDATADADMAARLVYNAKTRRVSVCNALDCMLVHSGKIGQLAQICAPLAEKNVKIYADTAAYQALDGCYPSELLVKANDDDYGTEFLSYAMAVRTVDSIDQALDHIAKYGSGHSESIVTSDAGNAERFQRDVDAACVYANAPTSFTDGAQFGLGAEIGISTQKLHARGPMGLDELMTYKWVIDGEGQTRP